MPHLRLLLSAAAALGLSVLIQPLPAAAQAAAADATTAKADLGELATEGKFTDVLDALKTNPKLASSKDADSLIASLERYEENQQQRQQRRDTAFEEAMKKVADRLAEDDLEEAMVAAIEAHSIADSPLLVLQNPAVVDLVTRTEIAAKQAELDEDWVEASVLFSRLNLLYEENNQYRPDIKRVGEHLRVLALYAPEELRTLQQARAERIGKADEFNRARPDDETWQTRLNGINSSMLYESIKTASQMHIDGGGYEKLLAGAINPLLTLLDTPALAATFPGIADEKASANFRENLLRMKAELLAAEKPLTAYRARVTHR